MFMLDRYLCDKGFINENNKFNHGNTNTSWKHSSGVRVQRRLETKSIYVYIRIHNTFINRYCINCKNREEHIAEFKNRLNEVMQSPLDILKQQHFEQITMKILEV